MTNHQDIQQLYTLYNNIKKQIKQTNNQFYQKWKAGGYNITQSPNTQPYQTTSTNNQNQTKMKKTKTLKKTKTKKPTTK